jgi:hypothetical protein
LIVEHSPLTNSEEGPVVKVCSQWFLDAIINDLEKCGIQLAANLDPFQASLSTELGTKTIIPAKNIFCAIEACRRLRSSLELFPSDRSRRRFFKKLSAISKAMREFIESYEWKDMYSLYSEVSSSDPFKGFYHHRDRTSLLYPERLMGKVPYWHPLNVGQNIWNKWLENRCDYEFPRTENKIIQRLPYVSLRIAHRTNFMYDIVERSYQQVSSHDLQIVF